MTAEEIYDLKPCPFCGGKSEKKRWNMGGFL